MNKIVKGSVVALAAVSMAACSSAPAGGTDQSNTSGSSTGSQVLNLIKENDVITMDSSLATDGTSFEAINMVIEGLETTDPEHNIVPALAESYDVSDDELTYTFHLRDAEWSNGDPVTAADFE